MASGSLEGVQLPPTADDLLQLYNSVLTFSHKSLIKVGGLNDLEKDLGSASRKRRRRSKESTARQYMNCIPLQELTEQEISNVASALPTPPTAAAISSSRLLSFDNGWINPGLAFATSTINASSLASILLEQLQSEMMKQEEEMGRFINIQGEGMKFALEEKMQRHARYLLSVVEGRILRGLKVKEAELEKLNRKNLELEDHVKQLSMQTQLWQNVAKNNEAMVSNLRTSLEQIVEVNDAESCYYGEVGDVHAGTFKENKQLKEQTICTACRTNNVCILLLPCRHLCLCAGCDSRVDVCPVCRSAKNASVQVYMI